ILGLGKGLKQSSAVLPNPTDLPLAAARFLASLLARAESTAVNGNAGLGHRLQAVKLVGCQNLAKAEPILRALLEPNQPKELQLAVLDTLADYKDAKIASWIIDGWTTYLPAVRTRAIRVLLSRDEWAEAYLLAVEKKQASVAEIDPPARVQL